MKKENLKNWQKDPKSITTDRVQLWQNGVMITAQISREDAQAMVRNHRAFVISSQAINSAIDLK